MTYAMVSHVIISSPITVTHHQTVTNSTVKEEKVAKTSPSQGPVTCVFDIAFVSVTCYLEKVYKDKKEKNKKKKVRFKK